MNHVFRFKDIVEWVEFSENDKPTTAPYHERVTRGGFMREGGRKFFHVDNHEEAYSLMCKGWPEGLKRMRKVMDCCRNLIKLETPIDEMVCAVEGYTPNIDAYLHGQPEDMVFLEPTKTDAPPSFLHLQLELIFNCMTDPDQAMWGGAVVFAASEALRAQGCNVTILLSHTISSGWDGGDKIAFQYPVPSNLDMDTIAFLFTHPAAFRIICFSAMEHMPEPVRRKFGIRSREGYGFPSSLKADDVHGVLQIQNIVHKFRPGMWDANAALAQTMLQSLVDTKFKSYMVEGDDND